MSDSAFFALRFVLAVVVLAMLFLVIRRAIIVFVGPGAKRLGRRKYALMMGSGLLLGLLLLMLEPVGELLAELGERFGRLIPVITPDWTSSWLVGLFHTLVALIALLFLIQLVGIVFGFFEDRLAGRLAAGQSGRGLAAGAYVLKSLGFVNRISRNLVLLLLVSAFVVQFFSFFRGSAPMVDVFVRGFGTPGRTIAQAILNYLPQMGYLAVIAVLGWCLLKAIRFTFRSIEDGTLSLPGFQPEWSQPTYKLVRFVTLMFLLMVSFPYLPGASSQFFQGFSVFVGALITFGSTGAITNIVSGITLTYTNAFHIGDLVRIGDNVGNVQEKTLLVTRLLTPQNETVTIPNSTILSTSILNYTALAGSAGLVLTVSAGIGYDVDWRTVHRLMLKAARRTEHVVSDPSPCVWQADLGDYAVSYQLRAWTDQPNLMFEIHSILRGNVLDEFNRAGVEIMTPSIFAHRDASTLAIPQEQLVDRPAARGIAVDIKPQSNTASAQCA
jgi:small-conductance mechanosensitive channel